MFVNIFDNYIAMTCKLETIGMQKENVDILEALSDFFLGSTAIHFEYDLFLSAFKRC